MLIGAKYKIESPDSMNVTLYRKEIVKKGGIRWRAIAYFATPANALKYLVDQEVKETGLKELRVVVEKIDELYRLVDSLQLERKMLQRVRRPLKEKIGAKG